MSSCPIPYHCAPCPVNTKPRRGNVSFFSLGVDAFCSTAWRSVLDDVIKKDRHERCVRRYPNVYARSSRKA
jgi:hypothetical protein